MQDRILVASDFVLCDNIQGVSEISALTLTGNRTHHFAIMAKIVA
jgi:hypothetical protein